MEEDMIAMFDSYKIVLSKAIARAIEANNKKLLEDLKGANRLMLEDIKTYMKKLMK
jgi:hypothetical protein